MECTIFVYLQNVMWVSYWLWSFHSYEVTKLWINRLAIHRLWFQQIYVEIQGLLIELTNCHFYQIIL